MTITVNGQPQTLEQDSLTVSELLVRNRVEMPDMVSVQIDGTFVEKKEYPATVIKDGDVVDFLYFMGGGSLQ